MNPFENITWFDVFMSVIVPACLIGFVAVYAVVQIVKAIVKAFRERGTRGPKVPG